MLIILEKREESVPFHSSFHQSAQNILFVFLLLFPNLLGELLFDDLLEGDSISSELADTFPELLDRHLVLVEVEAECGLVVDVGLLLQVERGSGGSVELLGYCRAGVVELLEEVRLGGKKGPCQQSVANLAMINISSRILTEMVR